MLGHIAILSSLLALLASAVDAAAADCPNANALGTSRTLAVSAKQTPRVGLKSFPSTLPLKDKEVVLTFDDGPFPPTTRQVLAALADQCVRAAFFPIGQNAAHNPDLVRKIAADGHTIAHHSWSHRILPRISPPAAEDEITRGIAAVETILHEGAPKPEASEPTRFFRFPGFAANPPLLDFVNGRNMVAFGADFWVSDWNRMSPEQEFQQLVGRLHAARKGIILMHDIKASTAAMLPRFLRYLKDNGYQVVHVVPSDGQEDGKRLN
jgi:peptidoglycan/xylan/chitin deacetylase (PgdA/CDA1 family)